MKLGRPSKYRKSFPQKAEKLWLKGCIDEEVARALKISPRQLYDWLKRYPELLQAQKTAKAKADALVERALFLRATGYTCDDCHVSQWDGAITVTPLKKHYPPDPLSMIFWLKNRKPKEWRDKTEIALAEEVAGVPKEVVEGLRGRFLSSFNGIPGVVGNGGNGNGH